MCKACDEFFKDEWRVVNNRFDLSGFVKNFNQYCLKVAENVIKKQRRPKPIQDEVDKDTLNIPTKEEREKKLKAIGMQDGGGIKVLPVNPNMTPDRVRDREEELKKGSVE